MTIKEARELGSTIGIFFSYAVRERLRQLRIPGFIRCPPLRVS
tara:strand:+ start:250 stop:378 length:129 start_codon:yes stop_codon:yes gene_type:complete